MGYLVGIDLGTTNSVIAYTENNRRECANIDQGAEINGGKVFPSCVAMSPNGELMIGHSAKRMATTEKAIEFKRTIGSDHQYKLGSNQFTAFELSTMLLREIRQRFESAIGKIDGAVITVPANYLDGQRREVVRAGELAGLRVLRIINEPNAAAIAYAVSEQPPKGHSVVIDWGGGTLDVSLVSSEPGVLDVLAADGDPMNGGKDLDNALFEYIIGKYERELRQHVGDVEFRYTMLRFCEELKIELSVSTKATQTFILKKAKLFIDIEVERREYEAAIAPWVDRVVETVYRTLNKNPEGAIRPNEIETVLLVGGSCKTPMLRRRIQEIFGKPGRMDLNPMEVVALGAAYQAATHHSEGDLIVVHCLATNLGTSCQEVDEFGLRGSDVFSVIIPATTKIPVEMSREYGTVMPNQYAVSVGIYESAEPEGASLGRCVKLDEFEVNGIKPGPAGKTVRITFRYDIQQLLTVRVSIPDDGVTREWTLNKEAALNRNAPGVAAKLDQVLDRAFDGYREFIARVERVLPKQGADSSKKRLVSLQSAIERQDLSGAAQQHQQLIDALFDDGIELK